MGVAAAATAAHAGGVVSRFNSFIDAFFRQSFPIFTMPARSVAPATVGEIAGIDAVIDLESAGAEAPERPRLTSARLWETYENTAKTGTGPRSLAPGDALREPTNELGSRVEAPGEALVELLGWRLGQGIWGMAVATALATVALEVDSPLATRTRIERKDPWTIAQLA
jgi:hypothetical protein